MKKLILLAFLLVSVGSCRTGSDSTTAEIFTTEPKEYNHCRVVYRAEPKPTSLNKSSSEDTGEQVSADAESSSPVAMHETRQTSIDLVIESQNEMQTLQDSMVQISADTAMRNANERMVKAFEKQFNKEPAEVYESSNPLYDRDLLFDISNHLGKPLVYFTYQAADMPRKYVVTTEDIFYQQLDSTHCAEGQKPRLVLIHKRVSPFRQ